MLADGRRALSGSVDMTLRLWDLETGESRSLRGHTDAVLGVTFSPAGDALASMSADNTVRLWADDLPADAVGLRAWLDAAVEDTIELDRPK